MEIIKIPATLEVIKEYADECKKQLIEHPTGELHDLWAKRLEGTNTVINGLTTKYNKYVKKEEV